MAKPIERLGPHSIEAEEAVLGSILINPDALDVTDFLEPCDFFELKHAWLWEIVLKMHRSGEAIDNLTLVEALRNQGKLEDIGGAAYITYLINSTPTHIYADTYAGIVKVAALRRKLMAAAGEIAQLAREAALEWPVLKAQAQTALDTAMGAHDYGDLLPMADATGEALDEWQRNVDDPRDVRGFSLGFRHVDQFFAGFDPGWVISFIMPTNAGKTTVALQMVWQSLVHQTHVLFVPTEMKPKRIVNRLVTQELHLPRNALRTGKGGEPREILDAYVKLREASITFLEDRRPTIQAIESKARALKRRLGSAFGVLVIDSASNVKNDDKSVRSFFDLTRSVINRIAALASDLDVLTICTWQINRASYGKQAVTSGRGGGDIENDSDFVFTFESEDLDIANGTKPTPANWTPAEDGKRKARLITLKDRETGGNGMSFPFWFTPGRGFVPEIDEAPRQLSHYSLREEVDDAR